jgi:NADH dehydrogenase
MPPPARILSDWSPGGEPGAGRGPAPIAAVAPPIAAARQSRPRPRIVIVGAGPAGIAAAKALERGAVDVLLIERGRQRTGRRWLDVRAVPCDPRQLNLSGFRTGANVELIDADVGAIDVVHATLRFARPGDEATEVAFDYLVVAVGAPAQSSSHPEVAADAALLTASDRPVILETRVWDALQAAQTAQNRFERARLLTFLVVGGGRRGAETAARIAHLARRGCDTPGSTVDPAAIKVLIFEAQERILGDLDPASARQARICLDRLGVQVHAHSEVTWVDRYGVAVGEARTYGATVVWTGETSTASLLRQVAWRTDSLGRAAVGDHLQVVGQSGVFVVGAAAAVLQDGEVRPAGGAAARAQGRYVGDLIARRVAGAPEPPPFRSDETDPTPGPLPALPEPWAIGRGSAPIPPQVPFARTINDFTHQQKGGHSN